MVSTTCAVAGPLVAAQWIKRWGVHAASCWCARGIGAATVRWRPLWGERRWLATRVPLAKRSTTEALRRTSSVLAHQRVGHGVVVAFDLHVGINIDTGELPLGILIGLRRQGPERRAVECVKQLLA